MVYCIYCGEKNEDGALKCSKCRKPLSLLPNDYPKNLNTNNPNYKNKKYINNKFRRDPQPNHPNFNQGSIKSQYNDFNKSYNDSNGKEYRNNQINRVKNLSSSQTNYYGENYRKSHEQQAKNYVEWDVVVATALLVIILATILQRFFYAIGLFIALFIGLIYILTATKSKLSLIKAIPLAIIMVLVISAYFSLGLSLLFNL